MQSLSDHPQAQTFLPLLRQLAAGRDCFLVGGAIRDWLLGRPLGDFDFATPFDPTALSQAFADQLGGYWFFLDEQRRQARVGVELGGHPLTFDFAPFRAATLEDDLALRDYTINAMALPLDADWASDNLVDPTGGLQDIGARQLRLPSETVLRSDPLRILKGLRHCLELGFKPTSDTLERMRQTSAELRRVAVERIRQEMLRILAAPGDVGQGIALLLDTGVGRLFWGEHFVRADRPLVHVQLRLLQFRSLLQQQRAELRHVFEATVEDGLSGMDLLSWHYFLETIYPGCALETAREWRFSRNAIRRLEALARVDNDLWDEFRRLAPGRRPLLQWARERGVAPFDLLLAMAFAADMTPDEALERVLPSLNLLAGEGGEMVVEDLVDGRTLQTVCGLESGPQVGKILSALRRAEAFGEIVSREQAVAYARSLCHEND